MLKVKVEWGNSCLLTFIINLFLNTYLQYLSCSHVREFVDRNGNDMEFTFKENKKKFVEEWKEGDSTCVSR